MDNYLSRIFTHLRSDSGENSVMQTITIAVSAILIAAGLTTAPGLINNARDNNAREDLSNLAYAQESILGDEGRYATTLGQIASTASLKVKLSGETSANVFGGADCYAVFSKSQSGKSFYRTNVSAQTFTVPTPWPTVKPSGYPANCAWPGTSSSATPASMTNFAPNPSFETAGSNVTIRQNYADNPLYSGGAGWTSYYNPTASVATDEYRSAPQSRKIVTGSDNRPNGTIVTQTNYLTGGENYASIWMKAPAGSEWNSSFRTSASGIAGFNETYGFATFNATGEWQLVQIQATLPTANYTTIGIQVKQSAFRAVPETAYFDDAQILGNQGFGDFFTGSTPDSGDFKYSWTGAVNNSVSKMTAVSVANVTSTRLNSYQSQSTKGAGSKSIAVQKIGNLPDAYASVIMPGAGKPNTTYTVAFTVWANQDTTLEARTSLQEYNGGWVGAYNVTPAGAAVTTEPKRYVMSGTSPAVIGSTLHLSLRAGANAGDIVYYDNIVVTEGTYDGTYFDGNGFGNKWGGAENNSASYGRPTN